jgi:hypothetical protein
VFDGFDTDYTTWAFSTWLLYALAAYYLAGFLVCFVRFETLERKAKTEGGAAVEKYNRALKGFPNLVYAKMFGKRAFEVQKTEASRTE